PCDERKYETYVCPARSSSYCFFGSIPWQACDNLATSIPEGENSAIIGPRGPRNWILKISAATKARVLSLSIARELPFQFQPRLPCLVSGRTMTSICGCPQKPGRLGGPSFTPGAKLLALNLPFSQNSSILVSGSSRLERKDLSERSSNLTFRAAVIASSDSKALQLPPALPPSP